MQHGRLAATGRSHDGDKLSFVNLEGNTPQSRHVDLADAVYLDKILGF